MSAVADQIIDAENRLGKGIDPVKYWEYAKQLADASGVFSQDDVDSMLMGEIRKKRGIEYSSDQQDVSDFVIGESILDIKPEKPKAGYTIDGKYYKDIDSVAAVLGEDAAQQLENTPLTNWSVPGGKIPKLKEGKYNIKYTDRLGRPKILTVEETYSSKK